MNKNHAGISFPQYFLDASSALPPREAYVCLDLPSPAAPEKSFSGMVDRSVTVNSWRRRQTYLPNQFRESGIRPQSTHQRVNIHA